MKYEEMLCYGPVEWCTVIEHHPWGLDVKIDDSDMIAVIDQAAINDDTIYINPEYWPPVGSRLKVRLEMIMPSGQVRYTAREMDLALPAPTEEWLESPAGRVWLASRQNNKPDPT